MAEYDITPVENAAVESAEQFTPIILNTIDLSTFEGRQTSYNAINNAEKLPDDTPIEVHDVIIRQFVRKDDDGTPVVRASVVFITPEGKAYYSASAGVVRSISEMLDDAMLGLPSGWPEHKLTMAITATPLNGGKTLKKVVIR